ncbi:MAG: hypothetical protein M0001_06410 [Treponema sp.]|nr:hypothetical protein [Treponema sp.]
MSSPIGFPFRPIPILVVALAFILAAGLQAQTRQVLPGFAALRWGSSRALVKKTFAEKGYFRLLSEDQAFAYFEGPWLGRQARIAIGFEGGRMFEAVLTFATSGRAALRDYRDLVRGISDIYGAPTSAVEAYQPPYEIGDGREIEAIRANMATISAAWSFADGNDISALIDRADLSTIVIYTNTALMAAYIEGLGKR